MPRYSVLDLSPIVEGGSAAQSLRNTLDLAQHAERWGYTRYWLAEHHNMPGIASAATSVVIGHVAGGTRTIRVGSGGVMLPNHAPLIVAEQFGTLATLYPGRIDLGVGRAPGTDMQTARALRRGMDQTDSFPQDVIELLGYLDEASPNQPVRAVPGEGTHVPVWILGSSLYGAQLAAQLGLPYAFASHFAPAALAEALDIYRDRFQPSQFSEAPYFMLAANAFAADDADTGTYLKTSMQQAFARLRSGLPGPLPRPVRDITQVLDAGLLRMVDQAMQCSVAGTADQVRASMTRLVQRYKPDEVIVNAPIHDHTARLKSLKITAEVMQSFTDARRTG
ncbi:LLM class flavin-dependent oxidoreductase [Sedimentitalea todarodis]|uniref:LLM class flavin-dependent oxidoreductase n=1 Tax=Sedimentitalea todarodis TaxID=1631240 RepID=A0ABU3VGE0_9RHOB|nr:LLM class flavin-dependent oxidoreductase [Sedimentitalea todarodis]MDU9005158.1 LLM class flavin-dependent oxidoreductase [Sedimentitalea todarodis]